MSDAIHVQDFNFAYGSGGVTKEPTVASVLRNVSFSIPIGARVLVVGLNGSGKSTLIRCLAGQHFHQHEQILVLGEPAFFSQKLQRVVTYLGSEWRNNALVRTDVPVDRVLQGATGYSDEKRDMLVDLLNVETGGSMKTLSDGQRQGVQIAAALMKPFELLLMDETTVECDVLVRKHLLAHLKRESETHKKTILYATHVFDGMASWPTHLLHVSARGTVSVQEMSACADYQQLRKDWNCDKDSPLSALIEKWLTADHAERQVMKREKKELPKTVEQVLDSSGKVGDRMYNYWN